MIAPIFAIVVIFTIWLNLKANRASRRDEDMRRAFWAMEHEANATRKKPLTDLPYIHVPEDLLPPDISALSEDAHDGALRIRRLIDEEAPIVNLTGYTNTELKLMYGVANLDTLTAYDTHYTMLVTSLQDCAEALFDAGRYEECERLLSFAVQTGTDVSATYRLLLLMYQEKLSLTPEACRKKLEILLETAGRLRSLSRDSIVKMLEASLS